MDVSSPDVQPSSASTTALHSTALNHDEMDCSDFPTPTNIIPVLLRISAAFYGTLPIPETSFVMACKKIQVLLYFSFGQDTTPLQQLKVCSHRFLLMSLNNFSYAARRRNRGNGMSGLEGV